MQKSKIFVKPKGMIRKNTKWNTDFKIYLKNFNQNQFDIILQNVADGITVLDYKGSLIFANTAAAKIFGFSNLKNLLENSKGKSLDPKFEIRDKNENLVPYEYLPSSRVFKGEVEPEAILKYKNIKTGNILWLHVKARAVQDNQKNIQFAVNIISDITDQQEGEHRKDEFIGLAGHELKTPLTSIKAFIQILQRRLSTTKDEEALHYLSKVDDQVNKLAKLVNDLLDISKIKTGKLEFRKNYFDFDQMVQEIIDEYKKSIESHTIIFTGSTKTKIFGDRDRIGQVLINLIDNAIKYSPTSNKIHVNMSTKNKHIYVKVQDFGFGIPDRFKTTIFDKFYQVRKNKGKTKPGLGIGLFISMEITKSHGGDIKVVSKEGKGSTFTVILPYK